MRLKDSLPFQNPGVNLYYRHDSLQHCTGRARKHFQNFPVHHHLINYRLEVTQGIDHFLLLLFQPTEILNPEQVEVEYRSAKVQQSDKNSQGIHTGHTYSAHKATFVSGFSGVLTVPPTDGFGGFFPECNLFGLGE